MSESTYLTQLKALLLEKIGATVYNVPADNKDLIVVLCRLKPMLPTDRDLKMAETRALRFIEDALKKSQQENVQYQVRFSRPWVLKGDKLAFTWDFTLKGDLESAISDLSSVSALKPPSDREEEVPVQTIKPRRGRVRQVSIGAIR